MNTWHVALPLKLFDHILLSARRAACPNHLNLLTLIIPNKKLMSFLHEILGGDTVRTPYHIPDE